MEGAARGVGLGGWEGNAPEEVSVTLTAALLMGKKPSGDKKPCGGKKSCGGKKPCGG